MESRSGRNPRSARSGYVRGVAPAKRIARSYTGYAGSGYQQSGRSGLAAQSGRWNSASLAPAQGRISPSGSSESAKRRERYAATALRNAGVPEIDGYWETSGTASRNAARMNPGVGSRGSPMPKS